MRFRDLVGRLGGRPRSIVQRPVLFVALVAVTVRVIVAVALNLTDTWSLAPDSDQYLAVAEAAADGRLQTFWLGYGESLYRSTWTYSTQVAALFELIGPYRALGQGISIVYGTGTAMIATAIALHLVRRPSALFAGLVVALTPSQVLWSSVALRESTVWILLALVGLILARQSEVVIGRRIVMAFVGLSGCYVALVFLRSQTAFLVLWCAAIALAIGPGRRTTRLVAVALFLILTPVSVGRSVGDTEFLMKSMGRLGTVRTYMAMDAEGAITELVPYFEEAPSTELPSTDGSSGTGVSGEQPAIVGNASDQQDVSTPDQTPAVVADSQPTMTLENTRDVDLDDSGSNPIPILEREAGRTDDGQKFIVDLEGQAVLVQDELSASMRALPRGLIAVALRPAPWEEMVTGKRLAAGIESILWLPVFVLAAIGAWVRRRDLAVVAFPSALVVAVLVSGAVTHGNLGTAFRHRGQILWALAVLSAVAVQHIQDRSSVETQEA